jgi:sRNA-binding carbon storage regulator CsrA
MLVVNRKMNESIVIDGNIKVTIVRLGRGNWGRRSEAHRYLPG